jgi:spore coat protein H
MFIGSPYRHSGRSFPEGLALGLLGVALLGALGMASGCGNGGGADDDVINPGPDGGIDTPPGDGGPDGPPPFPFVRCGDQRAPLPALVEDRSVYQQDQLDVWEAQVTLTDSDAFAAVNAGVPGATVPVHFSEGGFGEGGDAPNGILQIRGGFSRLNPQKNYKIKLDDGVGRWRGQDEINLNKHMTDTTRVRNKLAMELFQTIPGMASWRTHFVHLTVNGQDFGLYTWIEEGDKHFLKSHGLDPDGQLYKPASFHFQRIDAATLADPVAMEAIIESKATDDDAKLTRMLDALNDTSRPLSTMMDTYFNRENLVTWAAVNILVNNIDIRTQNFYIYSPSSCDGWYLLPWDYDGAWDFYAQLDGVDSIRERWERGINNYWPMNLFERVFTDPSYAAAIDAKVRELAGGLITDADIAARIARFRPVVVPYVSNLPDRGYLPGSNASRTPEQATMVWDREVARVASTPGRYLLEYDEARERPMPIFLATQMTANGVQFRWDPSLDAQGDPIAYDVQVARTANFDAGDIVAQQLGLTTRNVVIPGIPSGTYYWRVVIRDTNHQPSWQLPYDPYEMVTVP